MQKIKDQGDIVRRLKSQKAEKVQVCIDEFQALKSLMF